MHAIPSDIDVIALEPAWHAATSQNACGDIPRLLSGHGLGWRQGSVNFGDDTVAALRCIPTVKQPGRTCSSFMACVRDIGMLRIEGDSHLRPAVDAVIATN
jgi:virulence-associated protein VapD